MASEAKKGGQVPWRLIGWAIPVGLLMIPLVARWPWTSLDFLFAAAMFAIVGGLFELAVRACGDWSYRGAVAIALATSFMLVWMNGAVGIIGSEANPANLMFFVVIAVAIAGAIVARFQAAGMARAMMAAAAVDLLIAAIVLLLRLGSAEPPGLFGVVVLIILFAVPWLISAWLFRRAARS